MSLNKRLFAAAPSAGPAFNILTWTGNGGERSFTGLGFQPDWVVIRKTDDTNSTYYYESTSGADLRYTFNGTTTPVTLSSSFFKSFDTDGFSVYSDHNSSGNSFVAWCWKFNNGTTASNSDCSTTSTTQVNPDFDMSLITATAASTTTIGHGMSSTPTLSFYRKNNSYAENFVYTTAYDGTHDAFGFGSFAESVFNTGLAAPTSTCLGISGGGQTAMSFVNSDICDIGTYSGTGSSGVSVTTGFATNFVMIKRSGKGVVVIDSVRGGNKRLYWDGTGSESDSAANWQIVFGSTGFTINGTNDQINGSGDTYLYLAFSINT